MEKVVLFVVSAVGLPVLVYHGVEEPMIRIGKRTTSRIFKRRKAQMTAVAS
jgi:peptidoglycan/LPS O-acetylase OafA/YrhL